MASVTMKCTFFANFWDWGYLRAGNKERVTRTAHGGILFLIETCSVRSVMSHTTVVRSAASLY